MLFCNTSALLSSLCLLVDLALSFSLHACKSQTSMAVIAWSGSLSLACACADNNVISFSNTRWNSLLYHLPTSCPF